MSLALGMISLDFQCTWLAFKSSAMSMGTTQPKQADKSEAIRGREGDGETARILIGLFVYVSWKAVAPGAVELGLLQRCYQ